MISSASMRGSAILSGMATIIALSTTSNAGAQNLAHDEPADTVHPRMTEHSAIMTQQVLQVTDNIYLAYGYGLASSTMVIGDDGVIIIDVMEDLVRGQQVLAEFRKITDLPIKAIVYSHNHIDHTGGIRAFATQEQIASGEIKLIAHSSLDAAMQNWAGLVGPIISRRSSFFAGIFLDDGPEGRVNMGIGPRIFAGQATYLQPNTVFDDYLDLTVAGIDMHVRYVPSETNDEIVVWFPELDALQTGEVIQGESFPNLHTMRGTKYRDPVNWFKAVDVLRTFNAEYMVPSHGRPVTGKANVSEVLTAYRDAIQYVHDQSIRLINKGYLMEDLAEKVTLPPHLAEHPWLGELYGSVKNSVRQFYVGYIGWFQGDPWEVDRVEPIRRAELYVDSMGGREAILDSAQAAIDRGEHTWATEILTYLLYLDPDDPQVRQLKADALRAWAYEQVTTTWRMWGLTAALELEGTLPNRAGIGQSNEDIVDAFPASAGIELLTARLIAEDCLDVSLVAEFSIVDRNETYALEIRRGVAEFHDTVPESVDVTLEMESEVLNQVVAGQTTLAAALDAGDIRVAEDLSTAEAFVGYFEGMDHQAISLSIPVNNVQQN